MMPHPPIFSTPDPGDIVTVRLTGPIPSSDGEIVFHVRDGSLGTIHSCVAAWDGVRSNYEGLDVETFNLRTGAPETDVFSTNIGCPYDEHSRLTADPAPEAFDDGAATLVSYDPVNFADTAEIQLYSDLEAGSRFEVRYYFQVVDAYDTAAERAHITTRSDLEGEWAALAEVVSEADSAPSATSSLFIGKVNVSVDPDVQGEGDGSVWMPSGDRASVAYLDENGEIKATSDTSPPPSPTPAVSPTPTNVPGRYGDPYQIATPTKTPGPPKREVSVEFAKAPASGGETAVFFVRDNHLGTTNACTVEWAEIPDDVNANSAWDVVNGSPQPEVFSHQACSYDGSTPLATYPQIRALVNGVGYPVSLDRRNGRVFLLGDVESDSTVMIDFHYEVVDAFPAQARRARVYSSSDREGEWVAIREVASETNNSPAAASNLYRGEIEISEDPASLAPGDGHVRVRSRSRLSVAYYDGDDLTEPEERTSVGLDLPTPTPKPEATLTPLPTPTPIPAVSPLLLALVVGAGILVVLHGRRRGASSED